MEFRIGTPSQYSKSKMVSKEAPTSIPAGSYFLTAKEDGQVVGSLVAKKYEKSYVIRHVEVSETQRGKGIGTKLMEHIIDHLKPKNQPILLYVDPKNTPAVNLYKKLGFKLIKKGAAFGDKYALS
jgi:ribosomal protein S18 acetylase RimI-like enzyme